MSSDLTILYISASEMPEKWMKFQIEHLLYAVDNSPIISITRKPLDLGRNILDKEPKSHWNIYMQMLNGSLMASTKYVAMAEDDTLYSKEHFTKYRPPDNKVSYNRSRWSLFTWDDLYCLRQRISNCSLIAPRELLIEALTERKAKWPDGVPNKMLGEVGRRSVDQGRLGVTVRECVEWYSHVPIIQLNHPTGSDTGDYGMVKGRRMIKKHGQIKAYNIPYWGKAVDVIKEYSG